MIALFKIIYHVRRRHVAQEIQQAEGKPRTLSIASLGCPKNLVDAESMARELVQFNGREYVEMVRELSTALANAKKELEEANCRYERLTADLAKRGIRYEEGASSPKKIEPSAGETATPESEPADWEDWDRRFRSLLG